MRERVVERTQGMCNQMSVGPRWLESELTHQGLSEQPLQPPSRILWKGERRP